MPRLLEVELWTVKLRRGALAALPATVEWLRIGDSRLPAKSFVPTEPGPAGQATISRMEEVDLSDSMQLTCTEVHDIATAWPHITTLKMNGCVHTAFVQRNLFLQTVQNLDQLQELEANGVQLSDLDIVDICQNLSGTLRRLSIADCPLTNLGALWIASTLTNLRSLDISGCRPRSPVSFVLFAHLRRRLRYLNLSSTNVYNSTVQLLKLCMPACRVVH